MRHQCRPDKGKPSVTEGRKASARTQARVERLPSDMPAVILQCKNTLGRYDVQAGGSSR